MFRMQRLASTACFRISANGTFHPKYGTDLYENGVSRYFLTGFPVVILFAFLFVDLFDTLGTLVGVSSKADMLDKDGKLPKIKGALLADAVATTVGAAFGTSTTTTFVESASGVCRGRKNRTYRRGSSYAYLGCLCCFLRSSWQSRPLPQHRH